MYNGNDRDYIDNIDNYLGHDVEYGIDEPTGWNTPKGDEEDWMKSNRGLSAYGVSECLDICGFI